MTKHERIYDKMQKFRDGTGLTTGECARLFGVSNTTIQTIHNRVPNAGSASVLDKLETFELFPDVAILSLTQELMGTNPVRRNKAIGYFQSKARKGNERLEKIAVIRKRAVSTMTSMIKTAMEGEEEYMEKIYFDHFMDSVNSVDYSSWATRKKETRGRKRVAEELKCSPSKEMLSEITVIVPSLCSYIYNLDIIPTISKWYKKLGDHVKKGELLLEVDTDLATFEINAEITGVLETIHKEEGAAVESGEIVGVINPKNEEDILPFNLALNYLKQEGKNE